MNVYVVHVNLGNIPLLCGRSVGILLFSFASDAVPAPASERKVFHPARFFLFPGLSRIGPAHRSSRSRLSLLLLRLRLRLRLLFVSSTFLFARHLVQGGPLFILYPSLPLSSSSGSYNAHKFPSRLPPETRFSSALISRFTLASNSLLLTGASRSVSPPIQD